MRERDDILTRSGRFALVDAGGPGEHAAFARDVRAGLLAHPKRLPCWYFYDSEG